MAVERRVDTTINDVIKDITNDVTDSLNPKTFVLTISTCSGRVPHMQSDFTQIILTKSTMNDDDDGNSTDGDTLPSTAEPISNLFSEYFIASEHATERVAALINNDFECKPLFCQMDLLRVYKDDYVWKEMARWIRYEEDVEEGGQRWSKPHVASLMMEALQDLQNILSTCPVILDSNATTMGELADEVTDAWTKDRPIMVIFKELLTSLLMKRHRSQHFVKRTDMKKKSSFANLMKLYHHGDNGNEANEDNNNGGIHGVEGSTASLAMGEMNKGFMRHIPAGSQVVNLLVGELADLDTITAAFVRLKNPYNLGGITEVDLKTKFMFIVLGPKQHLGHCAEICRCMGALFSDEIFRCIAYRSESRNDLLCGIQEFSLHVTVLPPGVWNPSTRIEPPDVLPSQDYRKSPANLATSLSTVSLEDMDTVQDKEHQEDDGHTDPTLVRTGRLFGGLVLDIKRKLPFYISDIKDSLHIQCVASFFFLFLATLTPNVTFGGLLGQATDQYMGTMECILSAAISGVLFALFAGQPLNILGSTGPMLVLEGILFRLCKDQDWDFLPFRAWVGFWTGLYILLIVAFDLSALVRYITRFTEESFACLIALIFIYEAFKKTLEIENDAHVHFNPPLTDHGCYCVINNTEMQGANFTNETESTTTPLDITTMLSNFTASVSNIATTTPYTNASFSSVTDIPDTTHAVSELETECLHAGGELSGEGCSDQYIPDVFFFSIILFLGTYFLATVLFHFRHSLFFPTFVRQNVSDFSVLISIIVMVLIDILCGLPTPKLLVPEEFKPTRPGRPWFINPMSDKNPASVMLISGIPAILATILIFMDQQITAVIVNRKDNKLLKGSGYHLDMLIVGVLVVVFGLLGLPWYVAATVTALAHIMSLRKVSECTAPGEKPVFLGVREQRVTSFLVGVFSGLAVLFTAVLRYIPMPVLYGVFLYMGVAPLSGMQLVQRILLVFMPAKYQPEYSFIRNVPIKRVHIFTGIQVLCLASLWIVKSIKSISIAFPLMVLIICFIRKALDMVFTQRELKWLDDILPATHVKREEADVEKDDTEQRVPKFTLEDEDQSETKDTSGPDASITENGEFMNRGATRRSTSIAYGFKTDIDRIKAMTPEIGTNRKQSLSIAIARQRSNTVSYGLAADRKMTRPRRLSVEYLSPLMEDAKLTSGQKYQYKPSLNSERL